MLWLTMTVFFFFVLLCHAYRYASLDGITGYHKKYKADEEYSA